MPSVYKRHALGHEIGEQKVQMPIVDKVFATRQCIWCERAFEKYQIRCHSCHNCQYCGMVAFSNNHCQNCGNHTDDELKRQAESPNTVIF